MDVSELCDALELTEEKCKLLAELFPKVCTCVRGKRKPSAYNIHMGKCIPEKRKQGIVVQEAFKVCAGEYRGGKRYG